MRDWAVVFFILTGSLFSFLSALGLVRLPDLYTRMQATTKASTLGVSLMMIGLIIFFQDLTVTSRSILIIVFVFITTPVGAQMLSRASYFIGIPMWSGSVLDELEGKYDPATHSLSGDQLDLIKPIELDFDADDD